MEKEIKELYENGFNYKEIGEKLGKDQRTIKKIVINNGYQQLLKIRRCKYDLNENFLNHIGDNQLWFLGLMASDGYIINENRFGISQSGENGEKIIKYLKEILEYNGPIYFGKTIGKDKHSLIITSNKLVIELSKFNIVNKKSLIYEVPKLNSEFEVRDFVRGYIDGDGSIGVYDNGNGYEYLVTSFVGTENFIKNIGKLIPIKYSSVRKLLGNNCFEIRWYGKKSVKFCNWVYGNKYLYDSVKKNIFLNYLETHNPDYLKYELKKNDVKLLLNNSKKISEIVKITGIPFQTIYRWKKEF